MEWLIAPFPLDRFVGEVWELQPLVVKREDTHPDYYKGWFSTQEVPPFDPCTSHTFIPLTSFYPSISSERVVEAAVSSVLNCPSRPTSPLSLAVMSESNLPFLKLSSPSRLPM
jgi:hypothetical protein